MDLRSWAALLLALRGGLVVISTNGRGLSSQQEREALRALGYIE